MLDNSQPTVAYPQIAMELDVRCQIGEDHEISTAYYERETIHGATEGVIMKFVGSMHVQMVRPIMKS